MLVVYLTVDDVNQDLAAALAEYCGVTLRPVSFRDWPLEEPFDAVVYDLDSFPAAERDEILGKLLEHLSHRPAAVHSYNLGEDQVSRMRRNGVAVHRRLAKGVFIGLKLRRAELGALRRAGA